MPNSSLNQTLNQTLKQTINQTHKGKPSSGLIPFWPCGALPSPADERNG
jgi:hypothetical protein